MVRKGGWVVDEKKIGPKRLVYFNFCKSIIVEKGNLERARKSRYLTNILGSLHDASI
jgi:hypothetical protein